jgi:hypothetical protein
VRQPIWKCVGHIGDIDPIAHGGGFVYADDADIYPPEMTYFEPASDENWERYGRNAQVTVYRLVLDPPRFKTLTEKGKGLYFSSEELPASERNDTWYWYNEWYVKDLPGIAESVGSSTFSLLRGLMSKNPLHRAFVYGELIGHFGPHEFDSYPLQMTEKEAYKRYANELRDARKL